MGAILLGLDLLLSGDSAQPQVQMRKIDLNKEMQNCLNQPISAGTQILYFNPDSMGRATGATACISPLTGRTDTNSPQDPVGWQSNIGMDRSHVVGRQFGGKWERDNIIPMGADDNQIGMRNVERTIEGYLAQGDRVFYAGVPTYDIGNGIRPRGIFMSVGSSDGLTTTFVQNTKWDGVSP
ncbi:hypothetical protein ABIA33_004234 [Streptacidiphilus sp. MAP12-16]|uniref:DNA/RNA non-specific endonuclease n=1 Tax=Streptacidiphilus sp. MAP12-16 TaxID=3156300 RepID=UPI0035118C1B